MDHSLLEEQSKAYRVEGVDESAPTVAQKKRKKQHVNGEEVRQMFITAIYDRRLI